MKHNSANHMLIMALACFVPLALIFALSLFGISGRWMNFGAIALMVGLHFFMMKDHFLGHNHKEHEGDK